jgi:hypothetical protein
MKYFIIFLWFISQTIDAATTVASTQSYGVSSVNSNSYGLDLSVPAGSSNYGVGSQRSANGAADPNNNRTGQLFLQFPLTSSMIAQAADPNSIVSINFNVVNINTGVSGKPYLDGLDLAYLGTTTTIRALNTLWNTTPTGSVFNNIVATTGTAGNYTTTLNHTTLRSHIAAAAVGSYVAFKFYNAEGIKSTLIQPVGTSVAQTYTFTMESNPANYTLDVYAIPEVSSISFCILTGLCGMYHRRRTA